MEKINWYLKGYIGGKDVIIDIEKIVSFLKEKNIFHTIPAIKPVIFKGKYSNVANGVYVPGKIYINVNDPYYNNAYDIENTIIHELVHHYQYSKKPWMIIGSMFTKFIGFMFKGYSWAYHNDIMEIEARKVTEEWKEWRN